MSLALSLTRVKKTVISDTILEQCQWYFEVNDLTYFTAQTETNTVPLSSCTRRQCDYKFKTCDMCLEPI